MMWNSGNLLLHQLISFRCTRILLVENAGFLNSAREKSDGLPLLPHAFDHVLGLHPVQLSTDSNDQTRPQAVLLNGFSRAAR